MDYVHPLPTSVLGRGPAQCPCSARFSREGVYKAGGGEQGLTVFLPSCHLARRPPSSSSSTTRHARPHAALTMGVMLLVRAVTAGGGGHAGREGHIGRGSRAGRIGRQ